MKRILLFLNIILFFTATSKELVIQNAQYDKQFVFSNISDLNDNGDYVLIESNTKQLRFSHWKNEILAQQREIITKGKGLQLLAAKIRADHVEVIGYYTANKVFTQLIIDLNQKQTEEYVQDTIRTINKLVLGAVLSDSTSQIILMNDKDQILVHDIDPITHSTIRKPHPLSIASMNIVKFGIDADITVFDLLDNRWRRSSSLYPDNPYYNYRYGLINAQTITDFTKSEFRFSVVLDYPKTYFINDFQYGQTSVQILNLEQKKLGNVVVEAPIKGTDNSYTFTKGYVHGDKLYQVSGNTEKIGFKIFDLINFEENYSGAVLNDIGVDTFLKVPVTVKRRNYYAKNYPLKHLKSKLLPIAVNNRVDIQKLNLTVNKIKEGVQIEFAHRLNKKGKSMKFGKTISDFTSSHRAMLSPYSAPKIKLKGGDILMQKVNLVNGKFSKSPDTTVMDKFRALQLNDISKYWGLNVKQSKDGSRIYCHYYDVKAKNWVTKMIQ